MPFQLGMPTLIELAGLQEDLALCQRLGLVFIELNMNLPRCLPDALSAGELRAARERTGIGFTLHLPEELDFASLHPAIRAGHIETAAAALRWAGEAGIKLAVMHLCEGVHFTLPDRKEFIYAQDRRGFLDRLLVGFATVLDAAKDAGVTLCLENTADWTVPHLAAAMAALLQGFPAIGLCWDVGHDESAGRVNRPFFERHRPRLAHMHLHDADGRSNHKPLVTGSVAVEKSLLLAAELEIGVVVEVKTSAALEQSMRRLRVMGLA